MNTIADSRNVNELAFPVECDIVYDPVVMYEECGNRQTHGYCFSVDHHCTARGDAHCHAAPGIMHR